MRHGHAQAACRGFLLACQATCGAFLHAPCSAMLGHARPCSIARMLYRAHALSRACHMRRESFGHAASPGPARQPSHAFLRPHPLPRARLLAYTDGTRAHTR